MGRYTQADGRKSWNYSSTMLLVVVVSACLIGTWITISSLVDSAKNFEISVGLIKDVKLQMVNETHSREFEAKLGDFPEDGVNGNIGHIRGNDSLVQTKNAGVEVTDSGTSAQIRAGSMQTAELEKPRVTKKMSFLKDQKGYYVWKLCNVTAGSDYIPCLDNIKAIRKLPSISHYEHRERHCPDQAPTCLVSVPKGYKTSLPWPKSRDKIWFANVPHVKLVESKGHQNWVQVSGSYITFPGGGTQFKHGAMHYIDFIQKTVPEIAWGKRSRVVLDIGCGVASFGGYLFDREVLTMSLAPKDKHEAQVQFALERGIPAISAVMGTKKLPFPSMSFDVVHCARCRVPWHIEGGKLLLELDRVLRPGGYFVWSATPVYRKDPEDTAIWKAMSKLTKLMCWKLLKIGKDKLNGVAAAIYRKPTSNDCYESRTEKSPPLCRESDDPSAVWNIPLQACTHKVPIDPSERGYQSPAKWPSRLEKPPYWLKSSKIVVYGKQSPKDFIDDYQHWKRVVKSYSDDIGLDWSSVRNVMDMNAIYGGFAAALKDFKLWVMNVVSVTSLDTLPIIYERGLFGIYHDWCESFSTYPRSYDLLHANYLFSDLKKRCNFVAVMAEVDRILRPGGCLIAKDDAETIAELESLAKSLQWKIRFTFSKDNETILRVEKTRWRPSDVETIASAIA
ncbi:probable methyltransferase PMT24 [Amaranthus tricolor]|uniref:probable methyltransferase PMT24 n=1 Tax=Amaranthus tricolor TaxID=29722 RepID=UPI0025859376|nr:probable methyltransferase PMT24 [Amaranthus tricolor]XP_057532724.1 probable methyltransferase PMT24 [Amaranthus tricolor]